MFYDENTTPSSEIGGYVNAYWNDFLNYWELQNRPVGSTLSKFEREQGARLNRLGEALRESLHTLSIGTQARGVVEEIFGTIGEKLKDESDAILLVKFLADHPIVRHCIQINLAFEAVDGMLATAEKRLILLLSKLADRRLSLRASIYLDRTTRLFLWGFDPECVMMCHAVLESALKEWMVERGSPVPEVAILARNANAESLIDAAAAASGWTQGQRQSAHRLRKARNAIVHSQPEPSLTAEEALRLLAELLDALFPPTGAARSGSGA